MWQALQPIFENTCCPRDTVAVDDVEADDVDEDVGAAGALEPAGVGGSSIRMKAAKLVTSSEMPDARLTPLDWSVKLVLLSGKLLNWQFGLSSRSFGKPRLVTPCSTLYASAANIHKDLFCAFQPNRVMVPSLPL